MSLLPIFCQLWAWFSYLPVVILPLVVGVAAILIRSMRLAVWRILQLPPCRFLLMIIRSLFRQAGFALLYRLAHLNRRRPCSGMIGLFRVLCRQAINVGAQSVSRQLIFRLAICFIRRLVFMPFRFLKITDHQPGNSSQMVLPILAFDLLSRHVTCYVKRIYLIMMATFMGAGCQSG